MESVKKKIKEITDWVFEEGYPMGEFGENKELKSYRIDDPFFRYDLYTKNGLPSVLIVSITGDNGFKFPLWAAVHRDGEFRSFMSGHDIVNIGFGRRRK